jgi:hypothetical protein
MAWKPNSPYGPQTDLLQSLSNLGTGTFTPQGLNPGQIGEVPQMFSQPAPVPDWSAGYAAPVPTGIPTNAAAASLPGGNWWDGAIGTKEAPGWGGLALNAATGLAGTYLGLKQYGLAKDMFAENKRQYAQNFGAQANLTNSRLEDRQTRRNIERPDSMAVADYMAKYGVKA